MRRGLGGRVAKGALEVVLIKNTPFERCFLFFVHIQMRRLIFIYYIQTQDYQQLLFIMNVTQDRLQERRFVLKSFAVQGLIYQIILLFMFNIYVKVNPSVETGFNESYYPMYQDVNVMMLIGFGYLMVFIKTNAWSALAYTFIINVIVVQEYILWQQFWHKTFFGGWGQQILISETSFTGASYCVASILIAFGAVLGKVEPNILMALANFGVFFYTLNEALCYEVLGVKDSGGSTVIHTFGAYFGLAATFLLSRKINPTKQPKISKVSTTLAMIGTLFLWMFWPSFNAGVFPENQFEKSLVIANTVLSLTGSCIAAIVASILVREDNKIDIQDVLNATLAGGVIIGAPSGLLTNPAGAIAIGLIGGAVSTICFAKLGPKLKEAITLDDTCGVHNLHGIPGILGGILSAIVVAAYQSQPMDKNIRDKLAFYETNNGAKNLSDQAGIQIAGTFISLGIAIIAGLLAGLIMRKFSYLENNELYEDNVFFEVPEEEEAIVKKKKREALNESEQMIHPDSRRKILPPIYREKQIIVD